jgi:hypothetical protein
VTKRAPEPVPRGFRPPSATSPLRDYLAPGQPGVQEDYVVLPRALAEAMPLLWQHAITQIVREFHQAYAHLTWPEYRVVPSRRERLVNLDEDQLAEVGCLIEIDADGGVVYRERNGRPIADPESVEVLVSCRDPLPSQYRNANQDTPPRGFPVPPVQQQRSWS